MTNFNLKKIRDLSEEYHDAVNYTVVDGEDRTIEELHYERVMGEKFFGESSTLLR